MSSKNKSKRKKSANGGPDSKTRKVENQVCRDSDDLEEDFSGWATIYDTTAAVTESVAEVVSNIKNTDGLMSYEDDHEIINNNNNSGDDLTFDDLNVSNPDNVITENETNCSKGLGIDICDGLTRRERKNLRRRESIQCPTCGKTVNRGSMSKHAKTHTRVKKFQCEICGGGYDRQDYFAKHMMLHVDKKPYKCEVCGKAFNLIRKLLSHETIHTGLKPFICSICNTSFTESSALYKHMRGMHEGNKPYECSFCGKSFNESAKVKRHMRIHTGEKPYVCPVCSRAFNDRSAQLKHIRSHKGWESYAVATFIASDSSDSNRKVESNSSDNILTNLLTAPNGVDIQKRIKTEESYGEYDNEQSLPPIDYYYEDELLEYDCKNDSDHKNNGEMEFDGVVVKKEPDIQSVVNWNQNNLPPSHSSCKDELQSDPVNNNDDVNNNSNRAESDDERNIDVGSECVDNVDTGDESDDETDVDVGDDHEPS